MKIFTLILSVLLGLFMLYGGVNHLLKPVFYLPFVPAFLPFREAIVILSGVLEVVLGAAVLVPKSRYYAALSIMALMIIFLPVHIADVFSEVPAIGSHQAAIIRLPFQFVFILWGWMSSRFIMKKQKV
jgi:uncharacterized membrane protein